MPAHPTRSRNRTRGRGPLGRLARNPHAAGVFLAENPNAAKLGARFTETASARYVSRIAPFAAAVPDILPSGQPASGSVDVSYPARDRIGRRRPASTPRTPTVSGRQL